MNQLTKKNVSELIEDKSLSELVPEMTRPEYSNFIDSVKLSGIQTPIHIRTDMTILDGRHRVRACKQLGIKQIDVIVHDFDKSQSINFVRDTAIERRSLTSAQRIDIILRSSDLIDEIVEKAKNNQNGSFKGNRFKKVVSESDEADTTTGRTDQKLADIAGVGRATVTRMKKVKKESPELYEKVVNGEKTINGAYNELPTTATPKKRTEYPSYKSSPSNLNIPEPEPMTDDEKATLYASANLNLNFNQIIHYVADNSEEKIYEAIENKYREDAEFMNKADKAFSVISKLLISYKEEK